MLKKSLGFFVFAGLAGSVAVVGCSATATPADGGTTTDAAADTGKVPVSDAAKPVPDAAKPDASTSCLNEANAIALNAATTAPVKGQRLCVSTQIDAFATACLGTASTADTCKAFTDANKTCEPCLNGSKTAAPTPALYPVTDKLVSANVVSCGFLVIGKPECAIPTINYTMCYRSACQECDTNDKAATDACQKDAQANLCKSAAPTKECSDAYTAGKAQIDAACRGTDFNTTFVKVANYMCGTGVTLTDAGATDAATGG